MLGWCDFNLNNVLFSNREVIDYTSLLRRVDRYLVLIECYICPYFCKYGMMHVAICHKHIATDVDFSAGISL